LSAIDIDDALIVNEIRRGRVDRGLGDALLRGLFLEVGEPALEAAGIAAVGALRQHDCGRSGQYGCNRRAGQGQGGEGRQGRNLVSHWMVRDSSDDIFRAREPPTTLVPWPTRDLYQLRIRDDPQPWDTREDRSLLADLAPTRLS